MWTLLLALSAAWALPVQLPPDVAHEDWERSLALVGLSMEDVGDGPGAWVTDLGEQWRVNIRDPQGLERSVVVDEPRDRQSREGVVFLIDSWLRGGGAVPIPDLPPVPTPVAPPAVRPPAPAPPVAPQIAPPSAPARPPWRMEVLSAVPASQPVPARADLQLPAGGTALTQKPRGGAGALRWWSAGIGPTVRVQPSADAAWGLGVWLGWAPPRSPVRVDIDWDLSAPSQFSEGRKVLRSDGVFQPSLVLRDTQFGPHTGVSIRRFTADDDPQIDTLVVVPVAGFALHQWFKAGGLAFRLGLGLRADITPVDVIAGTAPAERFPELAGLITVGVGRR